MTTTLNPELRALKQQLVELSGTDLDADDALPLLATICHLDEFAFAPEHVPSEVALRILLGIVRTERRDAGLLSGTPAAETFDLIELFIETAQGDLR